MWPQAHNSSQGECPWKAGSPSPQGRGRGRPGESQPLLAVVFQVNSFTQGVSGVQETACRQQRSLVPMATGPALLFPGKLNPRRRGCPSNASGLVGCLVASPEGAAGHPDRPTGGARCCTGVGLGALGQVPAWPGHQEDTHQAAKPRLSPESCAPIRDELCLQRAWPRGCHCRAVSAGAGHRDPGQWGTRPLAPSWV